MVQDKEHEAVLQAITGLEKVASELSPANGRSILVKAKYSFDGLIAGNVYEVIEHKGWYYWLVCGGRWVEKENFSKL